MDFKGCVRLLATRNARFVFEKKKLKNQDVLTHQIQHRIRDSNVRTETGQEQQTEDKT